jgi:hypothetical protein
MLRLLFLTQLLASTLLFACGADAGAMEQSGAAWLDTPLEAFPPKLSAVGLYEDTAHPADVTARALAYAPEFPLWSNGSVKQRYLVLPKNTVIDSEAELLAFPNGSLLFKTFSFENADGVAEPVETRVLRKKASGWDYAAYLWGHEDAELLDGRRATAVPVSVDGDAFEHEVPSRRECRECHESAPAVVLGFNAWQLDYTPKGAHQTELERLAAAGAFSSMPDGLAIEDGDADTRWVKGYVAANCTHCHNGGDGPNAAFDMQPGVFVENTVGHETESSASGTGIRIAPHDPEQSVLYLGFTARDNGTGIKAMPPVGVQFRDASAARRLETWIQGL